MFVDEAIMDKDVLNHIQQVFEKEGTDAWWSRDASDFLPPEHPLSGKNPAQQVDIVLIIQ
jgi:isoleucyl-tRNA synthetase